jgi:uncharacterized repeat protein (TIGR03803 family)
MGLRTGAGSFIAASFCGAFICVNGVMAGALTASAQTIQTLYSLPNINVADKPVGNLLLTPDGVLYGSTYEVPAVFRVAPSQTGGGPWTHEIIAQLPFQSIGTGGVAADPKGNLYVADQRDQFSAGKMYQLTPPASAGGAWTMTAIYTFDDNNATGSAPYAAPLNVDHTLFGTTSSGGASGSGVIYSLKQVDGVWTYTVLHSFTGVDGATPSAPLVADRSGSLYGTTGRGGFAGQGVAFEVSPPAQAGDSWAYQVLYSFQGGDDGAQPQAGLTLGPEGSIYGTTSEGGNSIQCNGAEKIWNGCGTVFKLNRPTSGAGEWVETILHRFTGYDNGQDGGAPLGSMSFDQHGVLYSTYPFCAGFSRLNVAELDTVLHAPRQEVSTG